MEVTGKTIAGSLGPPTCKENADLDGVNVDLLQIEYPSTNDIDRLIVAGKACSIETNDADLQGAATDTGQFRVIPGEGLTHEDDAVTWRWYFKATDSIYQNGCSRGSIRIVTEIMHMQLPKLSLRLALVPSLLQFKLR